ARSTLGCGVTSTTKPTSVTSAAPMRHPRARPSAPPVAITSAMTTAQFAPETAVRWLSELDFIAEPSVGSTALVSPMARPGSRPPPSPGSAAAASANPARNPSAQARYQGGPVLTLGGDEAKNRNETSSPGPVAAMVPPRRMVVPIPSRAPRVGVDPFPAGLAANTVTGAETPSALPPMVTESSVAVNLGAPGCTVCVVTADACTNLPADAA